MGRKLTEESHENHERWLVSYADFMTLIFAFFVVMFASSQADKAKAQQVGVSITRALEQGNIGPRIAQFLGRPQPPSHGALPPKPPEFVELTPSLRTLTDELKEEIESGKISIALEKRGLIISLREAAFFPSGDDAIALTEYDVIEKVAAMLNKLPNPVRLEGHTDAMPIRNARFRDNWDLSAARSIAMLKLLTQRFAVPATRLAAVAYADTMPVDANDTPLGRARNRRVDIAVLNDYAARREAHPAAASSP